MKITEEHLVYLDELRESGKVNMFGSIPYIQDEFNVSVAQAEKILSAWMNIFTKRHDKK